MTTHDELHQAAIAACEEIIAANQEATANLRAILAQLEEPVPMRPVDDLQPEPMHTPAEIARMVDDGKKPWVRFVPSPRWRQIVSHRAPDTEAGRPEWALHYVAVDGIVVELVEAHTTLPAYSDAEFAVAATDEQAVA